ncbi:DUF2207 domain-containing protein [Candidatus Peregrinibacteria bacterium]|nr:DUF2207 domain-containing protein [Candidatus Peregrinibacteria bacterium]
MKKRIFSAGLIALTAALFLSQAVFAYTPWYIKNFDQKIEIFENGTLHVEETVVADFSDDPHRGIIRTIPTNYRDKYGNPFNLRFKLLSVKDENGKPHPIADQGRDFEDWDNYFIKIGDPDVYLNKITTYVITYEVTRAVGFFPEHDEIYWNLFTKWDVPVVESSATVILPASSKTQDQRAACFTGAYYSTASDCTAKIIDEKTYEYKSQTELGAFEGFTIVAGFSKGIVEPPNALQQILWFIFDNWSLLIPVFVFIFLFLKWWYTGRDPKTKDTIIPQYTAPKGLTATEVGTIIDEKVDIHDITTVIIDFAVKGFIKIKEIKEKKMMFFDSTDYELELLKDYKNAANIQSHEIKILDGVFEEKNSVKISDLKLKFYKHIPKIKEEIYENLAKGGYFSGNPEKIRGLYLGIGIAVCVISFMLMGGIVVFMGLTFAITLPVSGALFIIFSKFMPRKTLKGADAYIHIKGLEEYIRTAEKDRIKFQEKENLFFEKLLPYAMVLGLSEKWAQAFKDIIKEQPKWFEGQMDTFNTVYLVDRLNHFTSQANTAFAASPRSSGGSSAWSGGSGFSGGFSGGGFGGGGGSGW